MKLKAYAEYIAKLAAKYPNVDVVYAGDEEGNSYNKAQYKPTVGNFNGVDFISDEGEGKEKVKVNAICVN